MGKRVSASQRNATENQIPKSKRKRSTLNEEHLLSWNGLKRLYHNFSYRLGGDVAGNEAQALDNLLSAYRQWAFDLHPGYHFDQFLDRVETLGKNSQVRDLVVELREQEHKRHTPLSTETIEANDSPITDTK
ncbi:hypothetical protein ABG067_005823 [Albugo candida]